MMYKSESKYCRRKVVRGHKSKKTDKRKNTKRQTRNVPQNNTHKTKDWATQTPLKNQGWCVSSSSIPATLVTPIVLLLNDTRNGTSSDIWKFCWPPLIIRKEIHTA